MKFDHTKFWILFQPDLFCHGIFIMLSHLFVYLQLLCMVHFKIQYLYDSM